jgi:hypothetical protein
MSMKREGIFIKDQGKKISISFPHGKLSQLVQPVPGKFAFLVVFSRNPVKGGDQKNKSQPVLSVGTEAGPTDCAAQPHIPADNTGLLSDLPHHAALYILISLHLTAEPVVLPEMVIILTGIAMDKQYLFRITREDIAECSHNRSIHTSFLSRLLHAAPCALINSFLPAALYGLFQGLSTVHCIRIFFYCAAKKDSERPAVVRNSSKNKIPISDAGMQECRNAGAGPACLLGTRGLLQDKDIRTGRFSIMNGLSFQASEYRAISRQYFFINSNRCLTVIRK